MKNLKAMFTKKLLSEQPGFLGKLYAFRKAYLSKAKKGHYSQFGEDVVLNDWIGKKKCGFYVDVGCYHPAKHSNTFGLYKKGWRGINVDLSPLKIMVFKYIRNEDTNVVAAVSKTSGQKQTIYHNNLYSLEATLDYDNLNKKEEILYKQEVSTQTLTDILENSPYKDKEIDLLSIDVEGVDFAALTSLDIEKYKPKVILIEKYGKSIESLIETEIYQYLIAKGYYLANWVGYTLFFVSSDCDFISRREQ